MKITHLFALLLFAVFTFTACDDDDSSSSTPGLSLDLRGLEDLGTDYIYEGWVLVDGSPVSTGTFTVDGSGDLSQTSFDLVPDSIINAATAFVLTIEPSPDPDPAPSDVHILAGDFAGDAATMSVGHAAAIGNDFLASTGGYVLATPTDGSDTTDETSGVWFLDLSSGSPMAGLDLPMLPAGWKYEGWAVIDGTPVSTGTFTSIEGSDDSDIFSGTAAPGPPFPGEDFLMNAPSGLTFPTDLRGMTIVVSVEPSPDNSPAPFTLKPLLSMTPATATDRTFISMTNNAANTNPTGSVRR